MRGQRIFEEEQVFGMVKVIPDETVLPWEQVPTSDFMVEIPGWEAIVLGDEKVVIYRRIK